MYGRDNVAVIASALGGNSLRGRREILVPAQLRTNTTKEIAQPPLLRILRLPIVHRAATISGVCQ